MLYEVGKSESGEMGNEVLIGKAKSSFPGRGPAMRQGRTLLRLDGTSQGEVGPECVSGRAGGESL